jgi:uncharacterized RDD family membrane protein YckC
MYRASALMRSLAALIDCVFAPIILVIAALLAIAVAALPAAHSLGQRQLIVVLFLVYTATEVFWAATPGKMLLGLRIDRQDGSRASFWTRLLRWSTKYYALHICLIDAFFPGTALMAAGGFVNMFIVCGLLGALNDDRLTFHDQWSGTAVWCGKPARTPPPIPLPHVGVTN